MFKKKDGEEKLKDLNLKIDNTKNKVKHENDLKSIPDALMRFISQILLGNIDSLEKAENEYDKLLDKYDVKKLFKPGRTTIDSDASIIRDFLKDLEYIIFGT